MAKRMRPRWARENQSVAGKVVWWYGATMLALVTTMEVQAGNTDNALIFGVFGGTLWTLGGLVGWAAMRSHEQAPFFKGSEIPTWLTPDQRTRYIQAVENANEERRLRGLKMLRPYLFVFRWIFLPLLALYWALFFVLNYAVPMFITLLAFWLGWTQIVSPLLRDMYEWWINLGVKKTK